MAYTTEDGQVKHKTLWIVVFWCAMVVCSFIVQTILPELEIPLSQVITVAGTLSTAYVATDKGIKIAEKLKDK